MKSPLSCLRLKTLTRSKLTLDQIRPVRYRLDTLPDHPYLISYAKEPLEHNPVTGFANQPSHPTTGRQPTPAACPPPTESSNPEHEAEGEATPLNRAAPKLRLRAHQGTAHQGTFTRESASQATHLGAGEPYRRRGVNLV